MDCSQYKTKKWVLCLSLVKDMILEFNQNDLFPLHIALLSRQRDIVTAIRTMEWVKLEYHKMGSLGEN
jgi:hypothetical protein